MTNSNPKLSTFFPSLCEASLCTGCLACYNICKRNAIIIKEDEEGFIFPSVQLKLCVGCGLCESVCPILGKHYKNPVSDVSFAAWIKDKKVLRNSSSGGIYSVIAKYVLGAGGFVFGAAFDEKWNVNHIIISNEKELSKTRGSKYVQSNIGTTFQAVEYLLSRNKIVLFSATPCQIAGLKSYLNLVKCDTTNLYTIDLVCHGVPSPLVFKSYLSYLEKHYHSKLKNYSFRDKKWSWYRFNLKASFVNNHLYYGKWESDPFFRGFLREYYLRSSCHQCAFATEQRCGDFTLCDYWGYYKKPNEMDNNDMGVSLVIPNTIKAKKLYKSLSTFIVSYERNIIEAMECNQAFHKCFSASPLRDDFWNCFRETGFEGVIEEYLYPEEVQPQFHNIYKLGRIGNKMYEMVHYYANKTIRISSRIKSILFSR